MASEPDAGLVRFPAEYGTSGGRDSLRSWRDNEPRLRSATHNWVTTIGPGGGPHAPPVDGALCFGGPPATRWVRNLLANPAIFVSSEAEAIILEGTAEVVTGPAHSLAGPCMAASREKYPQYLLGGHAVSAVLDVSGGREGVRVHVRLREGPMDGIGDGERTAHGRQSSTESGVAALPSLPPVSARRRHHAWFLALVLEKPCHACP